MLFAVAASESRRVPVLAELDTSQDPHSQHEGCRKPVLGVCTRRCLTAAECQFIAGSSWDVLCTLKCLLLLLLQVL